MAGAAESLTETPVVAAPVVEVDTDEADSSYGDDV